MDAITFYSALQKDYTERQTFRGNIFNKKIWYSDMFLVDKNPNLGKKDVTRMWDQDSPRRTGAFADKGNQDNIRAK